MVNYRKHFNNNVCCVMLFIIANYRTSYGEILLLHFYLISIPKNVLLFINFITNYVVCMCMCK